MVYGAEKGSMECRGEFDVAYLWQGESAAQHWLLFQCLFLWEQLLEVYYPAAKMNKVMACLAEKDDKEPQYVVSNFNDAKRRADFRRVFSPDACL